MAGSTNPDTSGLSVEAQVAPEASAAEAGHLQAAVPLPPRTPAVPSTAPASSTTAAPQIYDILTEAVKERQFSRIAQIANTECSEVGIS